MQNELAALLSELPARPDYNPVRRAIELSAAVPEAAAALKLFSSMPPATAVLANPVRYHHQITCSGTAVQLDIRSFTVRGKLFEEDIVTGKADAAEVIFTGLFGRVPSAGEASSFRKLIAASLSKALTQPMIGRVTGFLREYPGTAPDIAIQYFASLRKAMQPPGAINSGRDAAELLAEMIDVHMEHVAVAAIASALRAGKAVDEASLPPVDEAAPFQFLFSMLLRHRAHPDEARILGQLGAIQVHHGSAGSNMVARYFASLHTRSVSDLFIAAQMALDCGRHFGAISDMTDLVRELESMPRSQRDDAIRARILKGNLPTFGHPEIAAAGRENHLEMDPRPALYLAPLFDALDAGSVAVSTATLERLNLVERIYQIALVEGVEKPGSTGRLRLTPNTDFGAWLVQEALGIEEPDRTLLSYAYRGFGWMMDVREQLQQPIIRPVIPPDPAIIPQAEGDRIIPEVISTVHQRLVAGDAFRGR